MKSRLFPLAFICLVAQTSPSNPSVRISALDDGRGQAIAAFRVRIFVSTPETSVTVLRKGSGGKLEFVLPTAGKTYAIQVEADGYLPDKTLAPVNKDGVIGFNARLIKGELFDATVVDAADKPVAGAQVVLKEPQRSFSIENGMPRKEFNDAPSATTDASGHFHFSQPHEGGLQGLIFHETGWAELKTDGSSPPPEIALHPWAKMEGRIVQGDKPLVGQLVLLVPMESRTPGSQELPLRVYFQNYHTTTDNDGRFSFDHVIDCSTVDFHVQIGETVRQPGPRSFVSANQMTLDIKPGEHRTFNIGGSGRTVTGRAVLGEEFKATLKMPEYGTLQRVRPQVPQPENWFSLSPVERRRLTDEFHQTAAWLEYATHPSTFPVTVDPDGNLHAVDVPPGTYVLKISLQGPSPENPSIYRVLASGSAGVTITDAVPGAGPVDAGTVELRTTHYPDAGDAVPELQVTTLDGKPLKLSDLRGKVVLMDFWATWCGPCVAQMPHLAELKKTIEADPAAASKFELLSVSVDERVDDPKRYVQAHPLPWTQAFAGALEASPARMAFGVQGIPSLWLIGPDGKILAHTSTSTGEQVLQVLLPDGKRANKPFSDELLDQTVMQAVTQRP